MSLILPPNFRRKRSGQIKPERFRGYAKHIPCSGTAFWFTKFGKAWFDYDISEVWFEDGQIKLKDKPVENYRCAACGDKLRGEDLRLIKIIHEDEAEAIHTREHYKVKVGEICELCGDRRKG